MAYKIFKGLRKAASELTALMEEKYAERLRKVSAEDLRDRIDSYDSSWGGILTDCFLTDRLKTVVDPLYVTAGLKELERRHRERNRRPGIVLQ